MTEILFYHLTDQSLEQALPGLVERSLERGWRVIVQCGSSERLDALDSHLWTFRDDSFVPHAAEGGAAENAADHPVWLTTAFDNANHAQIRFVVDNAEPPDMSEYQRGVFLFDGHDMESVSAARVHWKALKNQGHDLTYWQQAGGKWTKKA